MTNHEIDELIKTRAREITEGMIRLAEIKGSTSTDGLMTAIAATLQTIALLLAEQVKRMPEKNPSA